MAQLTIDGTDYPLLGMEHQAEPLAAIRRAQSTDDRAAQQGDSARGTSWPCTVGLLTNAEWATLETTLLTPGTHTLAGDQVGSPSVTCYLEPQGTQHGHQPDQVTVTFTVHEVGT
jgi:hypothetical protein